MIKDLPEADSLHGRQWGRANFVGQVLGCSLLSLHSNAIGPSHVNRALLHSSVYNMRTFTS